MIEIPSIDDFLVYVSTTVYAEESNIDDTADIYLITFSPDPSKLPDCDYTLQHAFNVNMLADYLKYCACGLWVHEFTQIGNPHYHGWYQVDSTKDCFRVVMMKVLNKFGLVKVTKVKSSFKINSYARHTNALGYYKKESFDRIMPYNPITKDSLCDYKWTQCSYFFIDTVKSRRSVTDVLDTISNRSYYTNFYKKSD